MSTGTDLCSLGSHVGQDCVCVCVCVRERERERERSREGDCASCYIASDMLCVGCCVSHDRAVQV